MCLVENALGGDPIDPGEPTDNNDDGDVTDDDGDSKPGDCMGAEPGDGCDCGIDICRPGGNPPKKLWDGIWSDPMSGLISGGESMPAMEFKADICPLILNPPLVMPTELPTLLSSESEIKQNYLLIQIHILQLCTST